MDNDYVEFFVDDPGEWRWRYRSGNNKNMADSGEGYGSQADAVEAVYQVTHRLVAFGAAALTADPPSYIRGVSRDRGEG